jgi:hypothetical protein
MNGSVGTDRVLDVGVALRRHGGSSMKPTETATAAVEHCFVSARVDTGVRERLGNCAYAYYFNMVTWYYVDGTLTLEGCVPTFYMKQILQTMLRDLEHVERIANEVAVISSTGLSSENIGWHDIDPYL